jgi:hypothetical protein
MQAGTPAVPGENGPRCFAQALHVQRKTELGEYATNRANNRRLLHADGNTCRRGRLRSQGKTLLGVLPKHFTCNEKLGFTDNDGGQRLRLVMDREEVSCYAG